MQKFTRTAVIMAGGSGERFWPLSRMTRPKQLLALATEKTMIAEAIDRASSLIPLENIFIITGRILLEPLRRALPQLPPENIIAEPLKRNTAPCLALAAGFISAKFGQFGIPENKISIAVLTADQIINPESEFIKTIEASLDYVEQNEVLGTIGIHPVRPETGYGYIEVEKPFDKNSEAIQIKPVIRFREKPNVVTAQQFVDDGNYLWNSGMFFWRLDVFNDQMKKCLPEVGNKIDEISRLYGNNTEIAFQDAFEKITPLFETMPNISIDYGLMEKADRVVVARAMFQWDDIGSWDSFDRIKKPDEAGNIIQGKTAVVDSEESIIINDSKTKDVIIAVHGLNNMVVVVTDDAVMVCPKDKVQEIKKCVEKIRKDGGEKWL